MPIQDIDLKVKKISLMAMMLIQAIPTFAGITAYFTMYSVISSINPGLQDR